MKEMNQVKCYFKQIREADQLIDQLLSSVQKLRSSLVSIGGLKESEKVQASSQKHPFEDTIIKIVDLEREIDRRIDELVDRKQEALIRIAKIPERNQQNVLIARYVNGTAWEDIAAELHFSISHVYRMHSAALLSFAEKNTEILKDESK